MKAPTKSTLYAMVMCLDHSIMKCFIFRSCFCSRAKRVLTEEAMAAGLQELHLVPPPPAAVVTTTVTVYTPATSSSTAWPAQQAIALSPHGYRAHALSGSCADTACAARESSNDVQQPDSLMCE